MRRGEGVQSLDLRKTRNSFFVITRGELEACNAKIGFNHLPSNNCQWDLKRWVFNPKIGFQCSRNFLNCERTELCGRWTCGLVGGGLGGEAGLFVLHSHTNLSSRTQGRLPELQRPNKSRRNVFVRLCEAKSCTGTGRAAQKRDCILCRVAEGPIPMQALDEEAKPRQLCNQSFT